jgi:hypothetical protein
MPNDDRTNIGVALHDAPATSRPKRPFGRSLDDFRQKDTNFKLLPAEEKLLAAVARGEVCDLGDYKNPRALETQLREATKSPEILGLAAEVVAHPSNLFEGNFAETAEDEGSREELEARINAQMPIVREVLKEFRDFTKSHGKAPKDLKVRVLVEPSLLRPMLDELIKRFESEVQHWRQVDQDNPAVRARAEFLRFLALGGDDDTPVHEKGIDLRHAFVDGKLDLQGCSGLTAIALRNCILSDGIVLQDACLRSLCLSGTNVVDVDGANVRIEGDVELTNDFLAKRCVRLSHAVIGGHLYCGGGKFIDGSRALDCEGARIRGDVYLGEGFRAHGEVMLRNAEIGGALGCMRGRFLNRTAGGDGDALNLQRTQVGKTVFLCDGFEAEGCVWLIGTRIGGSLACYSATFDNLVHSKKEGSRRKTVGLAATALDLTNASVADAIWLAPPDDKPGTSATIRGFLDFEGARARQLIDDPQSWPDRTLPGPDGRPLICGVVLDGFVYERLADVAPTDSLRRLRWLRCQPPAHLGADFRPQPFEQLIRVLREMGHEDDAKRVALEKQRLKRGARWGATWRNFGQSLRRLWGWMVLPFSLIALAVSIMGLFFQWLVLDLLLGGGYAKIRPMILFAVLLGGCAWYYDWAARQGAFVPANPALFNNADVRKACAGTADAPDIAAPIDWYRCKRVPAELNLFRPLVYSLDQMIPFIQLGQKRDWQPTSREVKLEPWGLGQVSLPSWTTQVVAWSQSIGSMLLYLVIAAILGGLIKRD